MQLLVLLLLSQSCLGFKKIYTDSCLCNFEVKVGMHQGSVIRDCHGGHI